MDVSMQRRSGVGNWRWVERGRNGMVVTGAKRGAEEVLQEEAGVRIVSPEKERERMAAMEREVKKEEGEAGGDEAKILRRLMDGNGVHVRAFGRE